MNGTFYQKSINACHPINISTNLFGNPFPFATVVYDDYIVLKQQPAFLGLVSNAGEHSRHT